MAERFYKGLRIQAHGEVHIEVARLCKELLPFGSSVLDVAAGQGALSRRLLDEGYKVACTSWDGKVSVPGAEVFSLNLDGKFGTREVGNRQYPCVLAIEIVEHVENPAAFLRSLAGCIAADGYVILSTPNVESALSRLQVLRRGCPLTFEQGEVRRNRHIAMLTRHILEYQFERAGLVVAEKHLVPPEVVKVRGPRSLAKFALVRTLKLVMQGDCEGESRLYVCKKGQPASEYPSDFY